MLIGVKLSDESDGLKSSKGQLEILGSSHLPPGVSDTGLVDPWAPQTGHLSLPKETPHRPEDKS